MALIHTNSMAFDWLCAPIKYAFNYYIKYYAVTYYRHATYRICPVIVGYWLLCLAMGIRCVVMKGNVTEIER